MRRYVRNTPGLSEQESTRGPCTRRCIENVVKFDRGFGEARQVPVRTFETGVRQQPNPEVLPFPCPLCMLQRCQAVHGAETKLGVNFSNSSLQGGGQGVGDVVFNRLIANI
jgi:hypothetical protein